MSTKTQRIMELFDETALSLSRQDNWLRFLKTAAWQYKYSFEDQLLIYAQRPDARACASIEVWNRNMQRWINRGARGIALFRENGSRYGLRYVFDVSDTNDRYNREIRLHGLITLMRQRGIMKRCRKRPILTISRRAAKPRNGQLSEHRETGAHWKMSSQPLHRQARSRLLSKGGNLIEKDNTNGNSHSDRACGRSS